MKVKDINIGEVFTLTHDIEQVELVKVQVHIVDNGVAKCVEGFQVYEELGEIYVIDGVYGVNSDDDASVAS